MRQTDFANDEAVGYLADRLNAAGVEDELMKAGAVAGDTVVIGDLDGGVVFDWEPTLTTGPELLGSRGTDLRLDQNTRPSRKERREVYHPGHGRQEPRPLSSCGLSREAGHWTDASDQS